MYKKQLINETSKLIQFEIQNDINMSGVKISKTKALPWRRSNCIAQLYIQLNYIKQHLNGQLNKLTKELIKLIIIREKVEITKHQKDQSFSWRRLQSIVRLITAITTIHVHKQ